MSPTGTSQTRLIVLRGNSGSGKSATARALRERLGRRLALVKQDYLRRIVLKARDTADGPHYGLIEQTVRYALDAGYDVVLEGILHRQRYHFLLDSLARDHRARRLRTTSTSPGRRPCGGTPHDRSRPSSAPMRCGAGTARAIFWAGPRNGSCRKQPRWPKPPSASSPSSTRPGPRNARDRPLTTSIAVTGEHVNASAPRLLSSTVLQPMASRTAIRPSAVFLKDGKQSGVGVFSVSGVVGPRPRAWRGC